MVINQSNKSINLAHLINMWRWVDQNTTHLTNFRVMLHIILLSTFYPTKIDVTLKITIGSKFNNDLS